MIGRLARRAAPVVGHPVAEAAVRAVRASAAPVGLALLYHRVGDPEGDPATELTPRLGTARFDAQLTWLARHFTAVPASALRERTAARRRGERLPMAITFDDDVPEHLRFACDVLDRRGMTATFFLCGHALDAPRAQWWERVAAAQAAGVTAAALRDSPVAAAAAAADREPGAVHVLGAAIECLTPDARDAVSARLLEAVGGDDPDLGMRTADVRRLAGRGHEIGFHTRRHDSMADLDDARLADAVRVGVDEIAAAAGRPLRTIAYPHGSSDARVAAAARHAGFTDGFTTQRRALTPADDPLLLPRLEPWWEPHGVFALRVGVAVTRAARAARGAAR